MTFAQHWSWLYNDTTTYYPLPSVHNMFSTKPPTALSAMDSGKCIGCIYLINLADPVSSLHLIQVAHDAMQLLIWQKTTLLQVILAWIQFLQSVSWQWFMVSSWIFYQLIHCANIKWTTPTLKMLTIQHSDSARKDYFTTSGATLWPKL